MQRLELKATHKPVQNYYAANLRRELPRIPFVAQASAPASSGSVPAPVRTAERGRSANSQPGTAALRADAALFHTFAAAGKKLAELHVGYEQQPEFPLCHRTLPAYTEWEWKTDRRFIRSCADFAELARRSIESG
jgi:hypothetical protein